MTVATILLKPRAELAYVFEVEGCEVAFTTTSDTAGIATAWAASAWTTAAAFHPGLELPAAVNRSIDLLGYKTSPVDLALRIIDVKRQSSTLNLALLFADDLSTATTTILTTALDRDDTGNITVLSSSSFPSSGTVWIGTERITYSSKPSGTTLAITSPQTVTAGRGTYSPFIGKANWSHDHKGTPADGNGIGSTVSSKPRIWKNRAVSLYITAKDPDTGLWVTRANCINDFVGFLSDGWSYDSATGEWTINAQSIEKRFETQILRDQFTATAGDGFVLPATASIDLHEQLFNNTTEFSNLDATITIAAGTYTNASLLAAINTALAAETAAARLTYAWSVSLAGDNRTMLTVTTPAIATVAICNFTMRATPGGGITSGGNDVMILLGAYPEIRINKQVTTVAGTFVEMGTLRAIRSLFQAAQTSLIVGAERGTWITTPSSDLPGSLSAAEGVIQIGDDNEILWYVTYNSGTKTFTKIGSRTVFDKPSNLANVISGERVPTVRMGDGDTIPVRQVWVVNGRVSRILSRLLVGTGTSAYNGGADVWPAQMGIGIPSTIIDINSLAALDSLLGPAATIQLAILEPEAATETIHSLMCGLGFHLAWNVTAGTIKAVIPTTIAGITSAWTLNSGNTGREHFAKTDAGTDLIRNRMTLLYNREPVSDKYYGTTIVEHLQSQAEHDKVEGFEYKARFLYDDDGTKISAWVQNVAAPTVAYFGHAIRRVVRSGARSLVGISLGDVVTLSDDNAPSAVTGTYGLSSIKAWIVGYSYDPRSAEFTEITLLTPTVKNYPYSPSGMLDYSRGDKGYDSAGPDIYLRANEFSFTSDTVTNDVASFQANDSIRIVEVDPASSAAPTTWIRTIVSVTAGSNKFRLSSTLSSPAFDTAKRYYVELDDYVTEVAANTTRDLSTGTVANWVSFIGDDATDTIGGSTVRALLWGMHLPAADTSTPDATFLYRRPYDIADDDGEPVSTHKIRDLAGAANNLYAHVTGQHPVQRAGGSVERSITGVTQGWLAGPFMCFCPPGVTTLNVTLWAKTNDAAAVATFDVYSTPGLPGGTLAAPTVTNSVKIELTTTATVATKLTTTALTLTPGPDRVCWITVLGQSDTAGKKAVLFGISGSFAAPDITV